MGINYRIGIGSNAGWRIENTPYEVAGTWYSQTAGQTYDVSQHVDSTGTTFAYSVASQARNSIIGEYGFTVDPDTGVITLPATLSNPTSPPDTYTLSILLSEASALTHGQPYTISGTGFGTRQDSSTLFWDHGDEVYFQGVEDTRHTGYSTGDAVPNAIYEQDTNFDPVLFDAVNRRHPRIAYTYKAKRITRITGGVITKNEMRLYPSTDHKLYMASWYRTSSQPGSSLEGEEGGSKFWRYYQQLSGETINGFRGTYAPPVNQVFADGYIGNTNVYSMNRYGIFSQPTFADYSLIEQFMDFSTDPCTCKVYVNNVHVASWAGLPRQYYNPDRGIHLFWGYDGAGGTYSNITTWFGELTIDRGFKRVVVGNAATYSACTQLELQRVTNWTDAAISIVGNQGGFDSLAGKYLYVIDENNNPTLIREIA